MRLRIVLAVAMAVALGGVLVGVVAWRVSATAGGEAFRGSTPPAGIVLPDFSLRDWTGERVQADDLRGRVALLTFLSSECTEACPIVANQIGRGLDLLGAAERERVAAVAISVDPEVDTPESVRAFLRSHRVEGELHYLLGSVEQLRPVWSAFAITSAFDTGSSDIHSAPVRVFDPNGEWVATLHSGVDLTPQNLAHDVRLALARGGG